MSQYWGRWWRYSEDQPVLTEVVRRSQAETSKEVLTPSQVMVLPGYQGMWSPQGDLDSGHWGGVAGRIMAPPVPVLRHLTEKMGLCKWVIKSRVLRCGDDPGLFR